MNVFLGRKFRRKFEVHYEIYMELKWISNDQNCTEKNKKRMVVSYSTDLKLNTEQ